MPNRPPVQQAVIDRLPPAVQTAVTNLDIGGLCYFYTAWEKLRQGRSLDTVDKFRAESILERGPSRASEINKLLLQASYAPVPVVAILNAAAKARGAKGDPAFLSSKVTKGIKEDLKEAQVWVTAPLIPGSKEKTGLTPEGQDRVAKWKQTCTPNLAYLADAAPDVFNPKDWVFATPYGRIATGLLRKVREVWPKGPTDKTQRALDNIPYDVKNVLPVGKAAGHYFSDSLILPEVIYQRIRGKRLDIADPVLFPIHRSVDDATAEQIVGRFVADAVDEDLDKPLRFQSISDATLLYVMGNWGISIRHLAFLTLAGVSSFRVYFSDRITGFYIRDADTGEILAYSMPHRL